MSDNLNNKDAIIGSCRPSQENGENKVNESAPKHHEMTYHYAGKVHVRGLLRRLWRPRYLALGDDGYLRYHESIPPSIQQGYQKPLGSYKNVYNLHHTHRPKSILAILDGARTIDPYSVVDQHVGLPQGVYGFVFRGRPVEVSSASSADGRGSDERSALVVSSETHVRQTGKESKKAAVVNLVFPKGTSRRQTAQKVAKAAVNPDICSFVGISGCRNSSSSSFGRYENSDEDDNFYDEFGKAKQPMHRGLSSESAQHSLHVRAPNLQSREYLCAVSTAAEAESWVVALRWAAERRRNSYCKRSSAESRRKIDQISAKRNENVSKTDNEVNSELTSSIEDVSHFVKEAKFLERAVTSSFPRKIDSGACSDSKGSLSSLISDEDSWCKAEKEKKPSHTASENEILITTHKNIEESKANEIPQPEKAAPQSSAGNKVDDIYSSTGSGMEAKRLISTPSRVKKSVTSENGDATIAITKVNKLRVAKRSSCGGFELFGALPSFPLPGDELVLNYEIRVLLLRNCFGSTKSTPNEQNPSIVQPELAEERVIYKSAHDILDLIDGLVIEIDKSSSGLVTLADEDSDRSTPQRKGSSSRSKVLCLLEMTRSNVLASLAFFRGGNDLLPPNSDRSEARGIVTLKKISSSIQAANRSTTIIDDVIKSLSKERIICSSRLFQDFLGLHYPVGGKASGKQVIISGNTEGFVRKWLCQLDSPTAMERVSLAFALTLRHKIGGPLLSLPLLWFSLRCISVVLTTALGTNTDVSIPMENYITIIALAFYCGHSKKQSTPVTIKRGVLTQTQQQTPLLLKKTPSHSNDIFQDTTVVLESSSEDILSFDDDHSTIAGEDSESEDGSYREMELLDKSCHYLSSPLPLHPDNGGLSCWSKPDHQLFMVRSETYLANRVKAPSAPAPFPCRGVDVWITDNAERNISRHPSILGGRLSQEIGSGTFIVNFLLPFGNLVAYFSVPPLEDMPPNIAIVWEKFIHGDQQYRDGKLKLLPVVVDGPWIVRKAVGPGTSPAMLGRDLPLQYYFNQPSEARKGIYEVDVLISASRIARGILNVVKGHTKSLTIAFAFIIEAAEQAELPETVLCAFQVHSLNLENCPQLPQYIE